MQLFPAEHNRYLRAVGLPQQHVDDPAEINIEIKTRPGHNLSHIALDSHVIPKIVAAVNTHDLARDKLAAMTDLANEIFSWLNHPTLRHKMCDGGRGNLGEQAKFHDMQRRLMILTNDNRWFIEGK